MKVSCFEDVKHRDQVIQLWQRVFGYDTPHNDPGLNIDRKMSADDCLFFVSTSDDSVIGTIMSGYDGHRGWIYLLAVDEAHRRQGIASELLHTAEAALRDRGCLKINLQIIAGNPVEEFYAKHGYIVEPRVSMGKRLFPGNA